MLSISLVQVRVPNRVPEPIGRRELMWMLAKEFLTELQFTSQAKLNQTDPQVKLVSITLVLLVDLELQALFCPEEDKMNMNNKGMYNIKHGLH